MLFVALTGNMNFRNGTKRLNELCDSGYVNLKSPAIFAHKFLPDLTDMISMLSFELPYGYSRFICFESDDYVRFDRIKELQSMFDSKVALSRMTYVECDNDTDDKYIMYGVNISDAKFIYEFDLDKFYYGSNMITSSAIGADIIKSNVFDNTKRFDSDFRMFFEYMKRNIDRLLDLQYYPNGHNLTVTNTMAMTSSFMLFAMPFILRKIFVRFMGNQSDMFDNNWISYVYDYKQEYYDILNKYCKIGTDGFFNKTVYDSIFDAFRNFFSKINQNYNYYMRFERIAS